MTFALGIYNASKAAVELFSETLRLEMAPLGVRVLTVVTGIVKTNIAANGASRILSPDSYYLPAQKQIAERAEGADVQSHMNVDEYASRVVGDILGGSTGRIWRGKMATMVRLVSMYMPAFLVVCPPSS
jgi:1-acylglycerone phosphate reductase